MFPDRDFDFGQDRPYGSADLVRDLAVDTVVEAMADGDAFVSEVCSTALLCRTGAANVVAYRQDVQRDLAHLPDLAAELYGLAGDALAKERSERYGMIGHSAEVILGRAVRVLDQLTSSFRDLRELAGRYRPSVASTALAGFFDQVAAELSEGYLHELTVRLHELDFPHGVEVTVHLGPGDVGTDYRLARPPEHHEGVLDRLRGRTEPSFTVSVPDYDDAGARILSSLRGRAITEVARVVADATTDVLGFFETLQAEAGFYLGCGRLRRRIEALGLPTTVPEARSQRENALDVNGLYDVSLALRLGGRVVGNDIHADGMSLVVVTGANQGGKSTFLRSVGLAQVMLGAGMFIGARNGHLSTDAGLFTHYRREEDPTMQHGKLDEELARMSGIADHLAAGSLLLSNESFAATNEREGSEIAEQILRALRDSGIRAIFITHLYELTSRLQRSEGPGVKFLRAERLEGGERTYRLLEAPPLPTSYGTDLYDEIFG